MADHDQRRHRRESITLIVEYEGASEMVMDVTENLSERGTFVRTTRAFEVGTEIKLVLSFPGLVEPVRLPGVVRWTRGGSDEERGVGIQFVADDEMLASVSAILDRIGAGDPELINQVVRVLVVEDNPHVARLIREGLTGSSQREFGSDIQFHFLNASNGRDALETLREGSVDVLVIDIYLPIMDGATVIAAVREDAALEALPIIAVSAGGKAARQAALEAGADFFLEKPMRLREIIESMRKLMPPPRASTAT
jgi:uncharacterized protein (TIGR02266 family)